MTDTMPEQMTELGPVDWVILEFPGSRFRGEIAPILAELVDDGVVRVLDLVLVTKQMDGTVEARELTDADGAEIGALREMKSDLTLLSEQDVTSAAGGHRTRQHRDAAGLGKQVGRPVRDGRTPRRRRARRDRACPGAGADRRT